jgi:hypothetical protein
MWYVTTAKEIKLVPRNAAVRRVQAGELDTYSSTKYFSSVHNRNSLPSASTARLASCSSRFSSTPSSLVIHSPETSAEPDFLNPSSRSLTTSPTIPTLMVSPLPTSSSAVLRSHILSAKKVARCGPHRQNPPCCDLASGYGDRLSEDERNPETSICCAENTYRGKTWVCGCFDCGKVLDIS